MAKCIYLFLKTRYYLLGLIYAFLCFSWIHEVSGQVQLFHNETSFSKSIFRISRLNQLNRIANKFPTCTCGVKASHNVKIVGGTLSKEHCWPWVAAIVYKSETKGRQVICGSSIITPTYLLTAGHCTEYILQEGIKNFRAILGSNEINDKDAIEVELLSAVAHPKFNPKTLEYDAGILELKMPVKYTRDILPICLTPQKGVPYVNKTAIVAGWGSTYFGGAPTTMQMQIMLGVISNSECRRLYKNESEVTTSMLCARRSGKDSCQGDSGGPIFILQDGTSDRYLQIGIVSFGKGCGDKRYPGIYSRVSRLTKWISSRTNYNKDNHCSKSEVQNDGNKASS